MEYFDQQREILHSGWSSFWGARQVNKQKIEFQQSQIEAK
jgi:hypothetical protein